MAQFLLVSPDYRSERAACVRLLGVLFIGSLTGALWAKLLVHALSDPAFRSGQSSWLLIWLRADLFPCLLAVSFLLGRRPLFYILFFAKGALVCFTLCYFSMQGRDQLFFVMPTLCFSSLLPLPAQLWGASVWLQTRELRTRSLILLVPMLLLALLGALIQTAVVS